MFVNAERGNVGVIYLLSLVVGFQYSLKFDLLLMSNISHEADVLTSLLYYNLNLCVVLHFT